MVTAKSEIGKGTTFIVEIPLGTEHLAKDKIKAAVDSAQFRSRLDTYVLEAQRWLSPGRVDDAQDGSGPQVAQSDAPSEARNATGPHAERILLADDNSDMREYVTRLLGKRYRVQAVSNGEEALEAALAEPPDLILSDVMMPGLDGFGLLKKLRASPQTRTIPIIFLSARAGEESRVEGLDAGADDYLIKPFTGREMAARVAAHLAMRRRTLDAEAALKESQAALQSFYDSSPFLMGVVELEGEEILPIYCNNATARFYGTDVESIVKQSKEQLGIPRAIDELWIQHYRQSQAEVCSVRFEYEHPRRAGGCWLNACVNFLGYGPSGRPRFSFIAEDVTGRRINDELLRRSNEDLRQANADLEQFAYSASHDLQEPLRQVAIYSQMLDKKYASRLDGKALEYLGYCIEGAQRMGLLISGLLAYSQMARKSESPLESVSIGDVLETVKKNLSTIIAETQAEISSPDLPIVRGDSVPLVHLFQNLLSNALKYRSAEKPRVKIDAREDTNSWRFSVEDNGIGIAEEFQTQIFGIFKRLHDRTEYPGTGIGLAICQKIVERYGGRIWVESEPGHGAKFIFTLPRAT
jgi:CheY-like chemotaxis protein/two-component sensor histidine kinase